MALLEVLAATAILAVAGLSLIQLIGEQSKALRTASMREREATDEDRLMTALSLLDRQDLERRLGGTVTGPYLVEVQRPEPTLFRVSVGRSSNPGVEDIVTAVFRTLPDAP